MVGFGLIFTVVVEVFVQPLASVPITVYTVVDAGLAETTAPLPEESPEEGLHTKLVPPPAVNVTDWPLQRMEVGGFTVIVGFAFTFTVTLATFEQPLASVPVTVYDVVDVGLAETTDPVVAESPVPGLHA